MNTAERQSIKRAQSPVEVPGGGGGAFNGVGGMESSDHNERMGRLGTRRVSVWKYPMSHCAPTSPFL